MTVKILDREGQNIIIENNPVMFIFSDNEEQLLGIPISHLKKILMDDFNKEEGRKRYFIDPEQSV